VLMIAITKKRPYLFMQILPYNFNYFAKNLFPVL